VIEPVTVVVLVGVLEADGLEVPEAVRVATALVEDDADTRRTVAVEFAESLGLDEEVRVTTLEREFDDVILMDGESDEETEAEVLSETEPTLLSVGAWEGESVGAEDVDATAVVLPLLEGDAVALTDTDVDFEIRGVDVAVEVCESIADSVCPADLVAVIVLCIVCEMALVIVALKVPVPPADLVMRVVLVTKAEADAEEETVALRPAELVPVCDRLVVNVLDEDGETVFEMAAVRLTLGEAVAEGEEVSEKLTDVESNIVADMQLVEEAVPHFEMAATEMVIRGDGETV
jgi:hypothetical protein